MNIIITLDYELFLGKNTGSVENCLIRPMKDLCMLANKFGFKYVLFVDAAYLLRLNQLCDLDKTIAEQYRCVTENIKDLSDAGHDIELHFHPQWLYSKWDVVTHSWEMDREHYKLSDMPEEDLKFYLPAAKDLLEKIVGTGKGITAFRAGGFCIDPYEPYEQLFDKMGIRIDSSVARNSVVKSPIHSYDYSTVPKDIIYRFENNIKKKNDNGSHVEVSISSMKWSSLSYLVFVRRFLHRYDPSYAYKDGESIVDKPHQGLFKKRLNKIFKPYVSLASIDTAASELLPVIFKNAKKRKDKSFVIIGHPKNVTDASLRNFENFLNSIHQECDFITMKDICVGNI